MTKERVESIRKIVLPFIAKKLKEIDYEGLGESDAKEFTNDFNKILKLAEDAIEQDCISRKFEKIVVEYPPAELCIYPEYKGKPYFSIQYEENGKHIIGFGTYNPEVLSRYLQEYFITPTIIEAESEIHCTYTDSEIAKSFIDDVEAVKDLLPRTESEE